jgi:hypothetical protein
MIGRCALGRPRLLACRKSFAASGSFGRGHRCAILNIDDVNIYLTDVAFPGSRIFTLSIYGTQYKHEFVSISIGASNIAIATKFRDPGHLSPTPQPGSRAAGSSPRRAGRNVGTARFGQNGADIA